MEDGLSDEALAYHLGGLGLHLQCCQKKKKRRNYPFRERVGPKIHLPVGPSFHAPRMCEESSFLKYHKIQSVF